MNNIEPTILTKEQKGFKHDVYLFNGHGETLINPQTKQIETFKLPHHTYYITTVKCGEESLMSRKRTLYKFSERNSFFDTIPENSDNFKSDLTEIFRLINPNVEIKGPDDKVAKSIFVPFSANIIDVEDSQNQIQSYYLFDGPPGLILRDNYIGSGKATLKNILNKRFILNTITDQTVIEKLEPYDIDFSFNIKNLPTFLSTSTYPTPKQFGIFFTQHNNDIDETFKELSKVKTPVEDIVNKIRQETDKIDPNRIIIFYNPLCRDIDKPERMTSRQLDLSIANFRKGKGRKTRRNKLKRQTRRRR